MGKTFSNAVEWPQYKTQQHKNHYMEASRPTRSSPRLHSPFLFKLVVTLPSFLLLKIYKVIHHFYRGNI